MLGLRLKHYVSIFLLGWLMVAGLCAPPATAALSDIIVDDIRFGFHAGKTRVVLDLTKDVDFRAFMMTDPERLVVDIPFARWRTSTTKGLHHKILKRYRSGQLDEGLTRIVFDLRQPAIIDNAFMLKKNGDKKDRLVIDLKPTSKNIFDARVDKVFGNRNIRSDQKIAAPKSTWARQASDHVQENIAVPSEMPLKKPDTAKKVFGSPRKRQYVVVVDAGHGGQDPGAIGKGGVYEKNLTLVVAKVLKTKLESTGRYKVVLTRDKDTYIQLKRRVDISRIAGADVFISLHADKIADSNIRGASIYTLSQTASDSQTARLAEQENNAGVVAGVDLSVESADVAGILLDLAMREKMNESNLLARFMVEALQGKKIRLLPNSHRSAGFAVLKAPDVPAILLEMGFLSNAQEAKLLYSSQFQSKIAEAIEDGLTDYFRKIEALEKY